MPPVVIIGGVRQHTGRRFAGQIPPWAEKADRTSHRRVVLVHTSAQPLLLCVARSALMGQAVADTERVQTEIALRKYAKQLRDLSKHFVDVQEEERRHLARELHDEIGQVLSAVSVNLQALNEVIDVKSRSRLDESIEIVDRAITQVRNLSLDLRPSMLDDLGLISTLRWYADRHAQRAGLRLEFVADATGDRLPAELEIASYRVVQEALTNIVRHAKATHVRLELHQCDAALRLVIHDDGIGFDVTAVREGAAHGVSFGVLGMRERVELIGGQIEIDSKHDHGTTIHVSIPIAANSVAPEAVNDAT